MHYIYISKILISTTYIIFIESAHIKDEILFIIHVVASVQIKYILWSSTQKAICITLIPPKVLYSISKLTISYIYIYK